MSKVYVHPVFADMTIFTDDRYIKGILYQLASGSSPPDFKYEPEKHLLHYKGSSITIDSNRVSSYQRFKSLIAPVQPKEKVEQPSEENWKKLGSDAKAQLLSDYIKKLAPHLPETKQKSLTSKLILWSEIAAFSSEDITWEALPQTKIKEISRVSFTGDDLKINHRTGNKTPKSTRTTNPFRVHVEKYINSLST